MIILYIARQPIFNRAMKVYGYELLFRADEHDIDYSGSNPNSSTAAVLGGLFELGLESLVGDKKAFVNFNYDFLMSDYIEIGDPEKIVLEILEDTFLDEGLGERLERLREIGYDIAVDDYDGKRELSFLEDSANIIKLDIRKTSLDAAASVIKKLLTDGKIIVAEKIESLVEYEKARRMGIQYFQGYFFAKPNIVGGVKGKKLSNVVYSRLMDELHREEPSFDKLSEIIAMDASLAYRLFSAASRKRTKDSEITSIKKALLNIGLKDLKRWVYILMLQEISSNKPLELMRMSLVRSKFGELIAENSLFYDRRHEVNLMGLFSVIDAMMDVPMEEALDNLNLSSDIKEALIEHKGELMDIGEIIFSYENGDWVEIMPLLEDLNIEMAKVFGWYMESCSWADKTLELI